MPAATIDQLLQQAIALHRKDDLNGAAKLYRQVLVAEPNHADALNLLGTVEGQRGRYGHAVGLIEAAIRLKPAEPVYRNNAGNTLLMAHEPNLAVMQLEEAVRLKPDYIDALCNLGKALAACGKTDAARAMLRKAADIDPSHERVRLSLAQAEQHGGRPHHAKDQFRKLLDDDPNDFRAIVGFLMSDRVTETSREMVQAESLLGDQRIPTLERSVLMHALAKAYDDLGRYGEAIGLVLKAKQLENVTFDISKRAEWAGDTKSVFTREFFAERPTYGHESRLPVFVVGMPRSGTTLVEQIIASHPKAVGAGELPHISRMATLLGATSKDVKVDAPRIRSLQPEYVRNLAEAYLARLDPECLAKQRIVDKSPLNLCYLGCVALAFRNASVIYCRRNALDTCLSIFMQKFDRGHDYSYDLGTLGRYYRLCHDLMDHWRKTAPLRILEIDYETIVNGLEAQARRIIDFLDLEWDDACLFFHKTNRNVATASQWQVRQPIYQTSIGRWRRYRTYLGPLIAELGDLADAN
ncbi:MAG TPA: sulfotransferase [Aestuariivirgaceae bacterium]|jgi:tetratricopeptide (TPR) repeat protein